MVGGILPASSQHPTRALLPFSICLRMGFVPFTLVLAAVMHGMPGGMQHMPVTPVTPVTPVMPVMPDGAWKAWRGRRSGGGVAETGRKAIWGD